MERICEHGWGWRGGSEAGEAEAARVEAAGGGSAGATGECAGDGVHVDDVFHVREIGVNFEEGFVVVRGEGVRFAEAGCFSGSVLFFLWWKGGKVWCRIMI